MATLSDYLNTSFDPDTGLPTTNRLAQSTSAIPVVPVPEPPKRNLFAAGLSAGIDELQGMGGAAVSAVGKLTGITPLETWGAGVAARNVKEAELSGRPDLETAPWREGGAPVLPWLGYQATKQLPLLAGYMLAGAAAPEVAVPAALASVGARVPALLGGGRGLAADLAKTAGEGWAKQVVGALPVGTVVGAGSMYGQALERGDPTTSDAAKALALAPIYGVLDAIGPQQALTRRAGDILASANPVKRVATAAAVNAASEAPQEALQTAMELSFRPDIPVHKKLEQIVDAGVTGGAIGGLFGGPAGLRRTPKLDPNASTDDIGAMVNEALAGPQTEMFSREEMRADAQLPDRYGAPAASPAPVVSTASQTPATAFDPANASGDLLRDTGADAGSDAYERLKAVYAPQRQAVIDQFMRPDADGSLTKWFAFVNGGNEPVGRAAKQQAEILRRFQESPESAALYVERRLNRTEDDDPTKPSLLGAQTRIQLALDQIPRARKEDLPGMLEPLAPALPMGRTQYESPVGPFNAAELQRLSQLDAENRLNPQQRDALAAMMTRMRAQQGQDLTAPPISAPIAPAAAEPAPASAPARPAAVAPEPPAVAAPTLQDLELLRSRGQATPSQLEQLAQVERLATPRAPETVLDARQIVPLLEAVRSGQATPEQNNQVARLVEQFRAQNQEIPETAGPARPAPYIQNISEDATGQVVQNDLAGRVQQAPVAPALDTTAQQRVEGLLRRVQAGERLSPVEQNAVNRELARRSAQPQAPVETQLDLGIPLPPKEYRAELKKTLAGFGKALGNVKIPDTVVDDASRNEWVLGRFNDPKGRASWPGVVAERLGLIDANGQPTAAQTQGATNAVQERGPAGVDVLQSAQTGGQIPVGNTQGGVAPGPGTVQAAEQVPAQGQQADGEGQASRKVTARDAEAAERGNGFTREEADQIIAPLLKRAKNIPRLVVLDTRQAPENALEANAMQGTTEGQLGYFSDIVDGIPTIVVVSNRHASAEQLKATVYHELLGHFGLRRAFGNAYKKLAEDLYKTPWIRDAVDNDPNQPQYSKLPKWAQVEEWIARQMESGPVRASLLDRLVGFVKSYARKWGYNGDFSRREIAAILNRATSAGFDNVGRQGSFRRESTPTPQANRTLGEISSDLPKIMDRVTKGFWKNPAVKDNLVENELWLTTINHIVERYGKIMPALRMFKSAQEMRTTLEAMMSQVSLKPLDDYYKLSADQAKDTKFLMSLTKFGIDPRKKWADNQHALTDDAGYNKAVEENWKRGYDAWNRLKRQGKHDVYENFVAVNEMLHYAPQAVSLYQMVQTGQEASEALKAQVRDPLQAFMTDTSLHNRPQATRDFWKAEADKLAAQVTAFIKSQNQTVGKDNKTSALAARVASMKSESAAMLQAPYFHMPRFGNFANAFDVRTVDGKVDTKAVEEIAKFFSEKGIEGITISRDARKPNVFIRSETAAEQEQIFAAAKELEKRGLIQAGTVKAIQRVEESDRNPMAKESLDRMVQQIQAGFATTEELAAMDPAMQKATKEAQEAALKSVRAYYMDMLPDTAYSKVMVHRENVSGNSDDFVRGFAFRAGVGSRALAGMYGSQKVQEALTAMRREVKDSRTGRPDEMRVKQMVLTEMATRESLRPEIQKQTWSDTIRAFNHAYFLGMSPSYVLVNLTQLGVLLMPELAKNKNVGFMKASKAIGEATKPAMAIISAAIRSGWSVSATRATDAIITEEVLEQAGIKPEMRDYLMKIVNSGKIDIGGSSREQGRITEGREDSKIDATLRWAAAFGYYSETFSRLVAAIAAQKLGLGDQAGRIIDESMLQYANWNTARALGKAGIAGQYTPLATAFNQYSFQVLEKLGREIHTAISKEAGAAEARRFLGYHLGAMTAVAGTLGLPFASVIARAIDGLKDLLDGDGEPYDVKAAWRNFLSDMFGKDVGEILARGVTRGVGIDISSRAGEQDLLPFSKLLADRREWRDASKDWAQDLLGSPAGMGLSILKAFEKFSKGDILGGMAEGVPTALKGPFKAYKYSDEGYVDNKGNKLPVQPEAADILKQAFGFAPANKAEYQEQKQTLDVRKGLLTREASNIRKELATAIENRDRDAAKEWMAEAKRFDKANPDFAVLPGLGSTLQRRARERAISESTGTPLGARPRELGRIGDLTRFANYD